MFKPSILLALPVACLLLVSIAQGQTVLRLNEIAADAGPEAAGLAKFKSEIETATQGAVRIELHFAGSLGNPATSVENMMSGDLDLFSGDLRFYLPILIDEVSGLGLPFLLPDNPSAGRYLASSLFDEGREKVLHYRRIRFLETEAFTGPERMIASTRPIASPEDLKGLKLAIFPGPSKAGAEVWLALGVTVEEIEWMDVVAALKQHRIDAVIAPNPSDLLSAKMKQVAPYFGPVRDHPQVWQISINDSVWTKLDPTRQAVFAQAAHDAAQIYNRTTANRLKKMLALRSKDAAHKITIDSRAVHERLLPAYSQLIVEGATSERVRNAADASIANSISKP